MNVLQQRALSQGVRVCVCDLCSGFILKNLCSQRACSTFRLVSRTLFGVVISDDQTTYFTGEVGQSLQRLRRAINTNWQWLQWFHQHLKRSSLRKIIPHLRLWATFPRGLNPQATQPICPESVLMPDVLWFILQGGWGGGKNPTVLPDVIRVEYSPLGDTTFSFIEGKSEFDSGCGAGWIITRCQRGLPLLTAKFWWWLSLPSVDDYL